jgi:cytochrome c5
MPGQEMAASHDPDHIEEHSSFIKTPKQLIVVILLAFLVPVMAIVLLAMLVTTGGFDADHPAMSDEAIAQRIKPVGRVTLGDPSAAPAAAPAAAAAPAGAPAPSAAAAAAPAAGDGKAIYEKVCAVCHAAGVAGAPKTGDKAAWAPRIKLGMEALYASSIKGKGAMPPKGGAAQLSDAEIKAAVDHLVGLAK